MTRVIHPTLNMQAIKLLIVLATIVALVHGTPAPKDGWAIEGEYILNGLANDMAYRMSQLKNIMVKVKEQLTQLETAQQLSNKGQTKEIIVREMTEANQLAWISKTSLNYENISRDMARPGFDLSLKVKLETLRAQMTVLDQELNALNVRVLLVLKD